MLTICLVISFVKLWTNYANLFLEFLPTDWSFFFFFSVRLGHLTLNPSPPFPGKYKHSLFLLESYSNICLGHPFCIINFTRANQYTQIFCLLVIDYTAMSFPKFPIKYWAASLCTWYYCMYIILQYTPFSNIIM